MWYKGVGYYARHPRQAGTKAEGYIYSEALNTDKLGPVRVRRGINKFIQTTVRDQINGSGSAVSIWKQIALFLDFL